MTKDLIPQEVIKGKILVLRGKKVMLDTDLAILYQVETKQLKRAVKRNIDRFPKDFMFELTEEEFKNLRCQIGTSNRGGTRYLPFAFTEHGILMISSVLNSDRAIKVNIQIMRAFTKMREVIVNYQEVKQQIETLERKYDHQFKVNAYLLDEVFEDIKKIYKLLEPPKTTKRKIGFQAESKRDE